MSDFKARQSSNRVARLLDEVSNTLRSQVDPLRDVTASDRVETERLAHENPVILALLDSLKNFVKNQAVPTADISTISANDSQRKFRHPSHFSAQPSTGPAIGLENNGLAVRRPAHRHILAFAQCKGARVADVGFVSL